MSNSFDPATGTYTNCQNGATFQPTYGPSTGETLPHGTPVQIFDPNGNKIDGFMNSGVPVANK